ncbi:TPA: hypothetical protein HA243_03975 [Candidatus Micrarchaeota archaeon]|nr:hypothetical protein [Candidatus Micrarchaeota archaeon]
MNQEKLKKVADALPGKVRALADYKLFELGKNAQHTVESVLQAVFEAALNFTSIEVISDLKRGSPSADTIRGHLDWKVALADVENMMKNRVKWLVTTLHRKFGRTSFEVAIDWTPEMYYGNKSNPFINGTQPKAGTCWAYEFFTVSIVVDGGRFLLFAYPLYGRENLLYYVNRALLFLRKLRIFASMLYFDRGFRSTDLFAYLQYEAKIPFITPAVQDDKFERWVASVEKFPVLFRGWQIFDMSALHRRGLVRGSPAQMSIFDCFWLPAEAGGQHWSAALNGKKAAKERIFGLFRCRFYLLSDLLPLPAALSAMGNCNYPLCARQCSLKRKAVFS